MKELNSGINEFREMADKPGVRLEIFKAGGDWRDQKWASPWSVALFSFGQGGMQAHPLLCGQAERGLLEPEAGKAFVFHSEMKSVFFRSFQVKGDVMIGAIFRSYPDTVRVGKILGFCELYTGEAGFLERFLVAVAIRTAQPFRFHCPPPVPYYMDSRLPSLEAPVLVFLNFS
ncbi:hypothetical protein T4B_10827 [Trichinella pseudospiralis]|uniref:Uncharacterized protein n=1 Tax=Trichinella pseudospiralis TaxID=6337 RepID=A0A0V1J624_TRIPS|nr:hypothetical protein T4B_10827 [Trichinella pseudospiralis]KRZ28974.1 hypothetical protein T4C_8520 [Trichinella pseudospiralis]KRZ30416.1 hypothetical protein T4C_2769 [Trichinella pseudospiralis]